MTPSPQPRHLREKASLRAGWQVPIITWQTAYLTSLRGLHTTLRNATGVLGLSGSELYVQSPAPFTWIERIRRLPNDSRP